MKSHVTVAGIVKFEDKVLLLKRNPDRSSSPNKWQPVTGFIKEREAIEDAVLREMKEETGLDGKIIKHGKMIYVEDEWGKWNCFVFLIFVDSDNVKIDENEHTEYKWIFPEEIKSFECIAGIEKDFESVGLT